VLAAIALGANLPSEFGEPDDNLREALRRLAALGRVVKVSSFYATEPVGFVAQPNFVNAALLLETALPPVALLHAMLAIEAAMGRVRAAVSDPEAQVKGPRVIDLDLLLCEGATGPAVLNEPELQLPHPAMHERLFVLAPLAEIAPEMQHPGLGLDVAELLERVRASGVR
jgi:2-amino-4-hydroxy-6-hydroxymethyldihydropteridine diphosphokinase